MTTAARPNAFRFVSADITGKTHISFLLFLLSGEPDFLRIDDNHKISRVDMWRKNRFFFAAQQVGSLYSDAAEHLVLGVNDPPFARHFAGFCGKGFQCQKKGTKSMGDTTVCQPGIDVTNESVGQMSDC